ncbi:MAG TPA: hypothetical protein VI749_06000 [Candidatus Omnitrophota bacterium]|nr:hypothetical protein [Candidatus Omnitrophota bacterium]
MKSGDKLLIILLVLSVLMMGHIMKENVISIRSAALSTSAGKSKVDVDKVKAQLQQAGLKLYEAQYWKMIGVQPQKD